MAWLYAPPAALVIIGLIVWMRRRGDGDGDDEKWSSAGGLVVNEHGEIALVLQKDRSNRLHWTLPKGRVDEGETAEVAALREVYEETGLRASLVRAVVVHEGPRHFTHYFEMALERDDGVHDSETKEVRFVSISKAAKMIRSKRDLAVIRRFVELRTKIKVA